MAGSLKMCLPGGYTPSFQLDAKKYNKQKKFYFQNGVPMEEAFEAKGSKVSRACRLLGSESFKYNNIPNLSFSAYYCDDCGDGDMATTRFRKCCVVYYIEDDKIMIYEPVQKNSGLPQGRIVNKCRQRKADGGYYSIDDLNIGKVLHIGGRDFTLLDCNAFTRDVLSDMGFRVPPPQPHPIDPLTEGRKQMDKLQSFRKPFAKDFKFATFLKNHPRRLRFYGTYCDENLFKLEKDVTLFYDLVEGTIKVVDDLNDRVLLRPTRVPKRKTSAFLIGEKCDTTMLNHAYDVKNVLISGQYYKVQNPASILVDSNAAEGPEIEYYTDVDLELGKPLNILGFTVVLNSFDEFTKNYYSFTHAKELIPIIRQHEEPIQTHKLLYKHEEFGPPEQTLRTNDPFQPIPYYVDNLKFFKNKRCGHYSRDLKILARTVTEDPVPKFQTFIVRFFLEDDTMTIRSTHPENRSVPEQDFVRRMKISKPQCVYENSGRCFYQASDMFVGNVIFVKGKLFELLEADEYTYDYMERNCDKLEFRHSNIKRLMEEIRDLIADKCEYFVSNFEAQDPEKIGFVTYKNFRHLLMEAIPKEMRSHFPEHALITVARHYSHEDYVGLVFDELVRRVHTELYRKRCYDFKNTRLALELQDGERKGYLSPVRVYYALRTTSLPINRDLLKSFIYKFPKSDNMIKYADLVETLDWIQNPTEHIKPLPDAIQTNWERIETEKNLDKIKYICLLRDWFLS